MGWTFAAAGQSRRVAKGGTSTELAVRAYLQEQEDEAITDGLAAAVFGEAYADFDDWEQVVPTGSSTSKSTSASPLHVILTTQSRMRAAFSSA